MSSLYHILCLSHDPAIVVESEWRSPEPGLAAIADRTHPLTRHHQSCDLLLGRYSYPLVEVCCPRTTPHTGFHIGYHPHEDVWLDAGWLRLLAVTPESLRTFENRGGCWTYETAHRLRRELGLAEEAPG